MWELIVAVPDHCLSFYYTGCNIHIGAKLYSLGRAKAFSSVATNFGLKTTCVVSAKSA